MTELGNYSAYEIMNAPNRYRRLFRQEAIDARIAGSDGMLWFALAADDEALRNKALDMMRADWPEKAHRAIGMEPHINLCDVVLIWDRDNRG